MRHLVRIIQMRWWKYKEKQALRMAQLGLLWDASLRELTAVGSKKNKKKHNVQVVDSMEPLQRYMRGCQIRFVTAIAEYLEHAKSMLPSVKDFVREKVNRQEEVLLPSMPDFHYLPTTEEMKSIIKQTGWSST